MIKVACDGQEVTLRREESSKAREIKEAAEAEGNTYAIMNCPEDRVSHVELGNFPSGAEIMLTMSMTQTAASSSAKSIFLKFPFESCSPKGHIITLDCTKFQSFLFEHEIEAVQTIASVRSNLGGEWIQRNDTSGVFRLTQPTTNASLFLTTTFAERMNQAAAVQFGDIVATFIVPEAAASSVSYPTQEYIFVLDCSGSMSCNRIEKAKECLKLYLHSLPSEGSFNIVRFGSTHQPMWQSSQPITDQNIHNAIEAVDRMDANLGGTQMATALNWILNGEKAFPGKRQQLFILTDGEDFDPDQVMELITRHRTAIRCFTIGLGHGADPGLVKGIANRTDGRYDFVYDGVDLRTKVIPQLAAAIMPVIEHVSVQISGTAFQNVVQNPIQPMTPDNLSVILIRSQGVTSDSRVLVTGGREGSEVEYVTPSCSVCSDESMIAAVSKYADLLELIDLEQQFQRKEITESQKRLVMQQAITLSIRSGILCPWTSFVGVITVQPRARERPRVYVWGGRERGYVCVELDPNDTNPCQTIAETLASDLNCSAESIGIQFTGTTFADFYDGQLLDTSLSGSIDVTVHTLTGRRIILEIDPAESVETLKLMIQDREGIPLDQQRLVHAGRQLENDQTLEECAIQNDSEVYLVLRLRGGSDGIKVSEVEPPKKANDISDLLSGHSIEGFWVGAQAMMAKFGLTSPPVLPDVRADLADKVLATVIALAILRKWYSDQADLWCLLDSKGLQWLNQVHTGVDWLKIIDSVVATLP
jgi:uncharacterized protein YegL